MGLFELTLPGHKEKDGSHSGKTFSLLERYRDIHLQKVDKIDEVMTSIPDGQCMLIWTNAAFNTMSLLLWQIKRDGKISELYISTYSFSLICLKTFFSMFDQGMIRNVTFLINSNNPKLNPEKFGVIISGCKQRGIPVMMSNNHAKVVVARSDSWFMTYTGSGNFSENATHEHYAIFNDRDVFDFYKNCIKSYGTE